MELNVSFESFATERDRKLASMVALSEPLETELRRRFRIRYPNDADAIEETMAFGKSLRAVDGRHSSTAAYFNHPLRVAEMVDRLLPHRDPMLIRTALIHNVFEVTGISEKEAVEQGAPPEAARAVSVLTIDREREPDARYLAEYYNAIRAHSEGTALIKCIDKLDNLWSLEVLDAGPKKTKYLDQCRTYVLPLAAGLSAEFGRYFARTLEETVRTPFNPEFRRKWDEFLSRTA
jgi:(p)ppGpp synthase/HD superfamily hydrolase